MDSCVLCKEELRSECVTVGQKGRRTLVTTSLQREDGLDKLLETIDPLRIHSFAEKTILVKVLSTLKRENMTMIHQLAKCQ